MYTGVYNIIRRASYKLSSQIFIVINELIGMDLTYICIRICLSFYRF